ncbi:VOC family protein [Pseudomonas sp. GCM10022186]|uniref:VOC family protein n=1 Tax=Pseudomonas sp. GCM10022186 TaxID=3252650 RepID=UPI00360CE5C6
MLSKAIVTTMLPVIDLLRARDFYESKLGLTPAGLKPDGKFIYECGGGALLALFPRPGGTKADHTAISFQVENRRLPSSRQTAWCSRTTTTPTCAQ